jgi:hypothetical protein
MEQVHNFLNIDLSGGQGGGGTQFPIVILRKYYTTPS